MSGWISRSIDTGYSVVDNTLGERIAIAVMLLCVFPTSPFSRSGEVRLVMCHVS